MPKVSPDVERLGDTRSEIGDDVSDRPWWWGLKQNADAEGMAGGGASPESRGDAEATRSGRGARLGANLGGGGRVILLGFKTDLYVPGTRWRELYSPPTTHFIATIEDLTDLLDFSSKEAEDMD
ncbi:hypothetical protein ZWY2020_034204, partial [Hordeum vulgare]